MTIVMLDMYTVYRVHVHNATINQYRKVSIDVEVFDPHLIISHCKLPLRNPFFSLSLLKRNTSHERLLKPPFLNLRSERRQLSSLGHQTLLIHKGEKLILPLPRCPISLLVNFNAHSFSNSCQ